ncbi:MAG: HIT domain-containing protein [Thermodesulfobacteriota bacterium]|nr:HIT domain-containing protein [Thermodesulfobacteriota bacterium]
MEVIWAPWRMEYITEDNKEACIFCAKLKEPDYRNNLILLKQKHTFVIMNKYPYNVGHLMVVPIRHLAGLDDFSHEELIEFISLTRDAVQVLKNTLNPQGFNLGMNIGRVAGAGVLGHIHHHIVPRWQGDFNYMPIIGETKVMPQHLMETYDRLFPHFEKLL